MALWWFHPLAWKLSKSARKDAEQAADDLVLDAGTKASEYAEHLLALVRGLREPISDEVLTMAMARSSAIEERLRSILDPGKLRRAPTARLGLMMGGFAAGILIGIPVAGWSYDRYRTYEPAFVACIAAFVVSALLAVFIRSDRNRGEF